MPKEKDGFQLFKRGDVYYFRIWDGDRRKYTSVRSTHKTSRDAAAIEASRIIDEGLVPIQSAPLAIDYIIDRLKKSQNTKRYIQHGVRYLEKYVKTSPPFEHLKLPKVKTHHLYLLLDHLKEINLTPRTINKIINYLRAPLADAFYRKYIPRNPVEGKLPKLRLEENLRERDVFTTDELNLIFSLPYGDDPRPKAWIVTAICTSMRKGELRAMRWQDVDLVHKRINVIHSYNDINGMTAPKTKKSIRDVPIFPHTEAALKEIWEKSPAREPDNFVFYQKNRGVPVPSHFADDAFDAVCEAAGITRMERKRRNLVPHSTRHTFVVFCRSLGIEDFIIGGWSGQITAAIQDRYGAPRKEHYENANESPRSKLRGI